VNRELTIISKIAQRSALMKLSRFNPADEDVAEFASRLSVFDKFKISEVCGVWCCVVVCVVRCCFAQCFIRLCCGNVRGGHE
jgi:hypothetical protein